MEGSQEHITSDGSTFETDKGYPKLKNYKWAGTPFWLLSWQEQLIRDIFGIVKPDGNRQFRTAFVEICKKVGKSELAAAIALYLLYADNEPSAEVYGAAVDRQQASIVFDVAKQMVEMSLFAHRMRPGHYPCGKSCALAEISARAAVLKRAVKRLALYCAKSKILMKLRFRIDPI